MGKDKILKFIVCIITALMCFTVFKSVIYAANDIIPGDVDSDGYITNNDRFILNNYLNGAEGFTIDRINIKAADINKNGEVAQDDCEILSKYLAGWNGYEDLNGFVKKLVIKDIVVDKTNVMTGQEIIISAIADGDIGSLSFYANVYMDGIKIDFIAGKGKLTYIHDNAGLYSFDLSIVDATGNTYSYYMDNCVEVRPFWKLEDVTVNNKSVNLGASIIITVDVDGAANDLRFSYTIYKDGNEYYKITDSENNTLELTAGQAGLYKVFTEVNDYYECHSKEINDIIVSDNIERNGLLNVNYGNNLSVDDLNKKDGDEVIVPNGSIILSWNKLENDATYELDIT